MKSPGEIIKQLRLERNMTQRTVSNVLQISGPALSKIENGSTNININRLQQFAAFFEVSIAYLLEEEMPADEVKLLRLKVKQREQEVAALQTKVISLYEEARRFGKY